MLRPLLQSPSQVTSLICCHFLLNITQILATQSPSFTLIFQDNCRPGSSHSLFPCAPPYPRCLLVLCHSSSCFCSGDTLQERLQLPEIKSHHPATLCPFAAPSTTWDTMYPCACVTPSAHLGQTFSLVRSQTLLPLFSFVSPALGISTQQVFGDGRNGPISIFKTRTTHVEYI